MLDRINDFLSLEFKHIIWQLIYFSFVFGFFVGVKVAKTVKNNCFYEKNRPSQSQR